MRYYRAQYSIQWYVPLGIENVLQLTGKAGYADGYNGKPLPFYKNFYLGGIGSVRGYKTASIGPQDSQGNALGGNVQLIGNCGVLFPISGAGEGQVGAPVGLLRCGRAGRHHLRRRVAGRQRL